MDCNLSSFDQENNLLLPSVTEIKDYLTGFEDIYSEAADINGDGKVVGYFDWDGPNGFLWEDGAYIELPSLGGRVSVLAISEEGYVTGESRLKEQGRQNPTHAFLWHQDIGIIDLGPCWEKIHH